MDTLRGILRLMRAGLALTAAADAAVLYALCRHDPLGVAQRVPPRPDFDPAELATLAVVSVGLYTYGMTQNDLVDTARDGLARRERPLVTGEVSVTAAWVVAVVCAAIALGAAASLGRYTLIAAAITFGLINIYHLATKTWGAWGLLNLGLVRLANAMMFVCDSRLTWPPFVLFCHVVLISTAGYVLEGKSPPLRRADYVIMAIGGLLVAGVLFAGQAGLDWHVSNASLAGETPLAVEPLRPVSTVLSLVAFAVFANVLWRGFHDTNAPAPRDSPSPGLLMPLPAKAQAGRLIRNGLLWLFVLDLSLVLAESRAGTLAIAAALAASWALMGWLRSGPPSPPLNRP